MIKKTSILSPTIFLIIIALSISLQGCRKSLSEKEEIFNLVMQSSLIALKKHRPEKKKLLIDTRMTMQHFHSKEIIHHYLPEVYRDMYIINKEDTIQLEVDSIENHSIYFVTKIHGKRLDELVKAYFTFSPFYNDGKNGFIIRGYTCGNSCSSTTIYLFGKSKQGWNIVDMINVSFS